MKKGYWIALIGSGGELDRRFVAMKEAHLTMAVIGTVTADWLISSGDTIKITYGESEND